MRISDYIDADLLDRFEFHNYNHAIEIITQAFPDEWSEVVECLRKLNITTDDLREAGGNETKIPKKFDDVLYPFGWREIRISGDLHIKFYPRQADQRGRFSSVPFEERITENYIDGHNIDFLKGRIAFDLEWNSKDILLYVLYSDFFLWLSKGNLCDPKFFIAQSAIFLLMALTIVVYLVRKHRRLVRIRLHYKVLILRDIIEPQIQKSSFTRLSEILTKAIYGTSTTQSVKEAFLEKVSGMSKDSALQYLDEFIDAYLLSDYRLSISVTEREHKVDKKEWKRLESKFNSPIDESLK